MDIATIGGLAGGFLLIVGSIIASGNAINLFINLPSVIIVIFGSFAAMIVASPLQRALGFTKFLNVAMNVQVYNKEAIITQLVSFADNARKEGLLSLDDALNDVEDDFLRGGLRLVVDGTDPDVIKKILYGNVSMIDSRHQDGIDFFGNWAKIAPAFGMIGTLLGLIGMMANLEDTASIGPNMAVALVTTLYGSIFANLVLMPIQVKLDDRNKEELMVKEIMIQGILSIQSGDNPRILEDKLYTYLPPAERPQKSSGGE
ncbi:MULTISPECIES: motility protein A [unclassified Oceanispirochaeta]|uniref:motility protein A n=1 Tax=unclassified Oceanispirochaeta TaxID=2635722 RepID=UPI000E098824|nr:MULTISPECIES: motility protein A [unclassified Oceanispirochaeta]MBF9016160.1 motility protein A [Oceanispirochaeta sp. M2]NPD72622.1 motility protein A [Oceanispirochaeta sp. M1]RDG31773.1 motility protein A [Oceanispirochaeta sp. M1]